MILLTVSGFSKMGSKWPRDSNVARSWYFSRSGKFNFFQPLAKERSRLPVNIFEASLNFFTIPWSTFPAANGTIAVTPRASIHCA